ncbi:hypothetical protein [Chryseobacterium taiwanense]|uniref:Uncharacterized protein n=1 Tax=Chryseobacterium taiwanense TaxID=363331 RepID=A0A0B4E4U7_9FLAO|nr:hypothetical protein [Chryseobacterium taiwanense]KIC61633.1 hypothetical protein RM51_14595 [Chryseobacterium taiwanense]
MSTNNVSIGKTTDSFEDLQILSQKEAEKIAKTLDIKEGEKLNFGFWTSDFPELICVAVFGKNEVGNVEFELDFEQTTL